MAEPLRSELEIIDDGEVISIRWESADARYAKFPDPLITVDYALDERAIGIVLVGSKARQLREAIHRPQKGDTRDT
jgi:hypothetical protein